MAFAKETTAYDEHFKEIGSHFGIPPTLLKKIAKIESNLNPKCVGVNKNKTVDYGLMQINSCHFKELGEDNDRIHLHGIFFGQKSAELIRKHWKYGFVFIGFPVTIEFL